MPNNTTKPKLKPARRITKEKVQEVKDKMIEAIFAAHEVNQKVIAFIETIVAECGKPKHDYVSFAVPEELFDAMKEIVTPEEMEVAVFPADPPPFILKETRI